ncbi:MAG: IS200/IS605 family transposase [Phycisphaeraceae bacterium]|nr:IS200/IS605 family transposase [Phycisphaeraceae bacterium]
MASTLTSLLIHVVFSTKGRADTIAPNTERDLYDYIGGICRRMSSPIISIGGTANHVHILLSLSKTLALADLMMEMKRDSSKMMKHNTALFQWQDGYFAFSIGQSGVEELSAYIASQKEHHRHRDFKDEVRSLCTKYGVALIEELAWD